ncbi:hypothetical protein ID866_5826 [Astraeus odoratus]|nr:hypothetical protein ID866_5826 [Astraeus odoratus]
MHDISANKDDPMLAMKEHLNAFRKTYPRGTLVPRTVLVVPTIDRGIRQPIPDSKLAAWMDSLLWQAEEENASVFGQPFDGRPETASRAVMELLNAEFGSPWSTPRPRYKELPEEQQIATNKRVHLQPDNRRGETVTTPLKKTREEAVEKAGPLPDSGKSEMKKRRIMANNDVSSAHPNGKDKDVTLMPPLKKTGEEDMEKMESPPNSVEPQTEHQIMMGKRVLSSHLQASNRGDESVATSLEKTRQEEVEKAGPLPNSRRLETEERRTMVSKDLSSTYLQPRKIMFIESGVEASGTGTMETVLPLHTFAQQASRYSINLNGHIRLNQEKSPLHGSSAFVYQGIMQQEGKQTIVAIKTFRCAPPEDTQALKVILMIGPKYRRG